MLDCSYTMPNSPIPTDLILSSDWLFPILNTDYFRNIWKIFCLNLNRFTPDISGKFLNRTELLQLTNWKTSFLTELTKLPKSIPKSCTPNSDPNSQHSHPIQTLQNVSRNVKKSTVKTLLWEVNTQKKSKMKS